MHDLFDNEFFARGTAVGWCRNQEEQQELILRAERIEWLP